ncbi:hypothetical protein [Haloprofundus salilacus]|nr:hypothetical protein [Haloprofundus salilacus]
MITGRCDHCNWSMLATSHPEMVQAFQTHLRENHHDVWVRT